jgi:hypothetical protein
MMSKNLDPTMQINSVAGTTEGMKTEQVAKQQELID